MADIAALHHTVEPGRYGDVLRWVVLGDHLSAGERDDRYDGGDGEPVPALLNPLAAGAVYVRPAALGAELLFGRLAGGDAPGEARKEFGGLLDALEAALESAGRLAGGELAWLAEHLTGAVYRGAMAVPSAFTNAVADIPLATHLHLAGAFAAALAADRSAARRAEEAEVGLVAGDVSGIQEFIHDTGSRRAARALRARSFYVQLLSLVAARWVALRCGVPAGCAFSVVGGRFLVAVPASAVDRVEEYQEELDRILWEAHGATLAVGLAGVRATGRELGQFRAVYERLQEGLGERKLRRYGRLARDGRLFAPREVLPAGRACRTCGREALGGRQEDDDGVVRRVCAMCHSLEELGRALLDRRFVRLRPVQGGKRDGWQGVMAALGHDVELLEEVPPGPVEGGLVALDDEAGAAVPCARYLPTARYAPRDSSGLLDFEEVARRGRGRPAIATLKADVDDLGEFLGRYFEARPSSPSRFLAVSTALSLFFEAYVPRLAAAEFQNIYLIFSGGDDVALAGPVDEVLRFGLKLRERFAAWTAGNAGLHFSAGLAAGHAHRPVQAGIEEAEAFLGRAKRYRRPDGEAKNAVTALDVVMGWEELGRCWGWATDLALLVERAGGADGGRRLARGALRHVQALEGAEPGRYGRLHWWSFYQLNRVARENRDAESLLQELRRQALEPGGAGGRVVALAARLAELLTVEGAR